MFFTEARPEELTPNVMVLLAQHLARHRLREPQLLEAIAHFLVVQEAQLSSKVGLPPALPCSSPSPPQCRAWPPVQLDWLPPAVDNQPGSVLIPSPHPGVSSLLTPTWLVHPPSVYAWFSAVLRTRRCLSFVEPTPKASGPDPTAMSPLV